MAATTQREHMKCNELMGTLRYWNRICPKLLVPQKTHTNPQSSILNLWLTLLTLSPPRLKYQFSILFAIHYFNFRPENLVLNQTEKYQIENFLSSIFLFTWKYIGWYCKEKINCILWVLFIFFFSGSTVRIASYLDSVMYTFTLMVRFQGVH